MDNGGETALSRLDSTIETTPCQKLLAQTRSYMIRFQRELL